jgi:hypothetical protein
MRKYVRTKLGIYYILSHSIYSVSERICSLHTNLNLLPFDEVSQLLLGPRAPCQVSLLLHVAFNFLYT